MTHPILPPNIPAFFDKDSLEPIISEKEQEIEDRKGEAKRIVKRLAAIVEEHRLSLPHQPSSHSMNLQM